MSVEKKFCCPVCGAKVPFSYALRIADGKRHECGQCRASLVPKTDNVIYFRIGCVIATLVFVLAYSKVVFGIYGFEHNLIGSLIHLAASVAFYLGLSYLAIVRVVVMKKWEE